MSGRMNYDTGETPDYYDGDEDDEPNDPNQCPECWGNLDEFEKCAECDY